MKIAHKLGFISTIAAALLFSGCGDSGSSTPSADVSTSKTITVERGPLLDANVTDALGHVAVELGAGKYAFDHNPEYPISATGGYIDVNRDGKIDAGEVKNELMLKTQSGDVVTMATTLASDANKTKVLQEQFELTKEQIETQTPGKSKDIEAFSNTLYAYAIENGYSDPSQIPTDELEALVDDYKLKRDAYKTDEHNAGEHEQEVMDGLSIVTLDDADAVKAQADLDVKLEENRQHHSELFGSSSSIAQHSSEAGQHSSEFAGEMGQESQHSSEAAQHSSEAGQHSSEFAGEMGQEGQHSSEAGQHSSEFAGEMSGQETQHSSEAGQHSSDFGGEMGQEGQYSSEASQHSEAGQHSSEAGQHSSEAENEDGHDNGENHSSSAGGFFNQNSTMRTTQAISI